MSDIREPVDGFLLRHDVAPTAPGPLDGLTFAVKDLIDVAGTVTGCGNPTWAASHPPAVTHAVVVELLLNAGARCQGKTITDEFAFSLVGENYFYGTPINPKAADRVPGGSSCGSASVVAAGEADFALGTDTAGSVRVPASNCGIYGLRPTWGRASMAGIQPLAPSFDTVGVLARDPGVLDRVSSCLWPVEASPVKIRRVLMLEQGWDLADPDVKACRRTAAAQIARLGLDVESIELSALVDGELGEDFFAWKSTFSGAQWPEVWSVYGSWLTATAPALGPKIAENFALVKIFDRMDLTAGLSNRAHARHMLRAFLPANTTLCVPTTSSVAPMRGKVDYDRTGTGYLPRTLCLTAIAGICGLPQLSIPFTAADGLPAGVSLIGAPDADLALIALAREMQG